MNLRILKKLSKRAAPILLQLQDHRTQFRAAHARQGENYHGLCGFPLKNWERSSCHPSYEPAPWDAGRIKFVTRAGRHMVMSEPSHPLKGTMMVGGMSGYYEPEWDEESAWGALDYLVRTHFTDWGAEPDPIPTRRIQSVSDVFAAAVDMIEEYRIATLPRPSSGPRKAA